MGSQTHGKNTRSKGDSRLIAWGITGGEFYLREVVNFLMSAAFEFDIFLSQAGEELLERYSFKNALFSKATHVFRDDRPSAPPIMRLFSGRYAALVVAPATSNTVAKMVCGIADTLVTNMFAQAGKVGVPSIVLPTDHSPFQEFTTVSGRRIRIKTRIIDLQNVHKLSKMDDVTVVKSMKELQDAVSRFT